MAPTLPRTYLPTLPQTNAWTPSPGRSFPSAREQQEALAAAGQRAVDTYDLLSQLGSIITAVLHEIYGYPLQTAVYAGQAYVDYKKGADAQHANLASKSNPLLTAHGLGGGASPVTARYLVTRRWKKIGGGVVQTVGNLMSLSPANLHQNVAGAVYHGHATATTARHVVAMEALAHRYRMNQELLDWIMVVRVAKLTKLTIRGAQLAGAIIPAASLPTSVIAAAAKAGVKMTYAGACFAAAAKLHFAAHFERHPPAAVTTDRIEGAGPQAVVRPAAGGATPNFSRPLGAASATGGGGAPVRNFSRPFAPQAAGGASAGGGAAGSAGAAPAPGLARAPALAPYFPARTDGAGPVIREIFTRRLGRQLLGAYDVEALIDEPAGWLALADKLMLI